MISKWVEYHIVCDECGINGCLQRAGDWWDNLDELNPHQFFAQLPFSTIGKRDMRKVAKKHKWVYKNGKDICPRCYANMS